MIHRIGIERLIELGFRKSVIDNNYYYEFPNSSYDYILITGVGTDSEFVCMNKLDITTEKLVHSYTLNSSYKDGYITEGRLRKILEFVNIFFRKRPDTTFSSIRVIK